MKLRNTLFIASAWLLVACQGEVVPTATGGTAGGPGPTGTVPTPAPTTQNYTLDFSKGSFEIGYRRGYWLGFDFSQLTQSYVEPAPWTGKIAPNVATSQPLGSYCEAGLDAPAETFSALEPGDAGWVDHVDVDMTPPAGVTVVSDMCFGYRDPDGTWHWKLTPRQPTWDAAQGRFHMSFEVKQGPLAGFAILTNQGPFLHLEQIVVAARKASP